MRTRENGLWKWLKRAEAMLGAHLHMRRVENLVGVGDPDVEGVYNSNGFDIELKSVARPARGGKIYCELSPDQALFARSRLDAGGRSWILVQVGQGNTAARYLIHGKLAGMLLNSVTEEWLVAFASLPCNSRPEEFVKRAAGF